MRIAGVRMLLALCLSLLVVAILAGTVSAADWPMLNGPDRDNVSKEQGTVVWPPVFKWEFQCGTGTTDKTWSSPAVVDGKVYVTSMLTYETAGIEILYCLDKVTGALVWSRQYVQNSHHGAWGPRGSPTVVDNEVHIAGADGGYHVIDKNTSALLWEGNYNGGPKPNDNYGDPGEDYGVGCSAVVDGNTIIYNISTMSMAINRNAPHEILWRGSINAGRSYITPSVFTLNGRRVMLNGTADVAGIQDVGTGAVVMSLPSGYTFDEMYGRTPVLYGANKDKVFGIMGDWPTGCGLFQINSNSLTKIWSMGAALGSWAYGQPCVFGDHVYGVRTYIECVSMNDGSLAWREDFGGRGNVGAYNTMFIHANKNAAFRLIAVKADPTNYNAYGEYVMPGVNPSEATCCTPAISDGMMYWVSRGARVICLQVATNTSSSGGADVNSNSMPDAWETENFGGLGVANGGANDDYDSDGQSNLGEYLAGTNPNNSGDALKLSVTRVNGQTQVSFFKKLAAGANYAGKTRYYTLESTTSLSGGSWQTVSAHSDLVGDNSLDNYVATTPGNSLFFRVRARLQ